MPNRMKQSRDANKKKHSAPQRVLTAGRMLNEKEREIIFSSICAENEPFDPRKLKGNLNRLRAAIIKKNGLSK